MITSLIILYILLKINPRLKAKEFLNSLAFGFFRKKQAVVVPEVISKTRKFNRKSLY